MKELLVHKLTSRKFWAAVISFVSAMLTYFGSEGETESVTCLIWAGASLIAYIVGEGLVDQAAVREGEETEC